MKTRKAEIIRAQSDLPISKLLDKLRQITAEEFGVARNSKEYQYYGKINNKAFDVSNVKFSLYGSGPSIQGEIEQKSDEDTLLNFNVDIEEDNNYANSILILTVIIIAISATLLSLGSHADKLITLAVFAAILVFSSCYVMITKLLLKIMKKNELKKFLKITESKLI